MFEGWQDFFLLAGSAAAVLIGLIFVVISLLQDRSRSSVLAGSRLYMGPIVLGVSFVLALSAAGLTPGIGRGAFAAIAGALALWGLARGIMSTTGIRRLAHLDHPPHWTDLWFYGLYPSLLYLVLGIVALTLWREWRWADEALAAVITASLLLAIRNEWDLITWIAPQRSEDDVER
jgi:chromate transport protein ChrA